jgi:hypothetical protein
VLVSVSPDEGRPEFRLDEETGTCGSDVAPGTSCFVDVVFERLEGGTGLASLVVESNAGDPIVLQLAGTPEADVPAEALSQWTGSQRSGSPTSAPPC